MSHRRPRLARLLATATVALSAAVALPSAASAASIYQFDQFRLAGGTRFTLTVSRADQVAGLPTAPKGYRRICGATGPVLRNRLETSFNEDTVDYKTELYTAKANTLAFSKLGDLTGWTFAQPAPAPSAFALDFTQLGVKAPSTLTSKATLPQPALYDLTLVPYSDAYILGPVYIPAAFIQAKLDIHLDTTNCPLTTSDTNATYVRAR